LAAGGKSVKDCAVRLRAKTGWAAEGREAEKKKETRR